MINNNLLVIFVKNPELGKCKTRLAATIGDEKALRFYKNMLVRTKEVTEQINVDKAIYYSSFIDQNDIWSIHPPFYKFLQNPSPDLGIKMKSAFEDAFESGYESVCIIGSDCYALDAKIIAQAFESLKTQDAVLGPSNDGGYYLLGMNRLIPEVFADKKWSTESVAPDTIQDFNKLNLQYSLLEGLTDIDTEEDLKSIPDDIVKQLLI